MDPRFEHGEQLMVSERVIVAPAIGLFRPRDGMVAGMPIGRGQPIGDVDGPGTSVPVCSAFDGFLQGSLALPGERLRRGQPVAWLRVA